MRLPGTGKKGERAMEPVFIRINDDILNVSKIQAISYEDQKNCLGNDSGVYILHIYMENDIGSHHKAYDTKSQRDKDYKLASHQLSVFSISKLERRKNHEIRKMVRDM